VCAPHSALFSQLAGRGRHRQQKQISFLFPKAFFRARFPFFLLSLAGCMLRLETGLHILRPLATFPFASAAAVVNFVLSFLPFFLAHPKVSQPDVFPHNNWAKQPSAFFQDCLRVMADWTEMRFHLVAAAAEEEEPTTHCRLTALRLLRSMHTSREMIFLI
jgi:hypothetical protein